MVGRVYGGAMRGVWCLLLLVACSDGEKSTPDGDPPGPDACRPDLFGERCDLAPEGAVGYCRGTDLENSKGACIDERGNGVGVCRPWACSNVPHCTVADPPEVQNQCPRICGQRIITDTGASVCVPL